MYAEQSGLNLIAAFYAFKPGDLDRDNDVDQDDVEMFKPELTLRGQLVADTLDLKFDMTGNNTVDWKDVKTLQNFYDFRDGDANIDQQVNLAAVNVLAGNFGLGGKVWTQGDFTGDDQVNLADFNILAGNFGLSASYPTGPTPADWAALAAAVPEPTIASLVIASLGAARRHRRGMHLD
jgi:hypothetical protein